MKCVHELTLGDCPCEIATEQRIIAIIEAMPWTLTAAGGLIIGAVNRDDLLAAIKEHR